MNLDQQIRRRLIAAEEGRYPGSLTGKVFELTTAIRAVLHETARWREGSVHGTPAGLALQLEGLIAIQLGITEKQDETDTTAGESPCPTCQSLNVIGTKSYWTCNPRMVHKLEDYLMAIRALGHRGWRIEIRPASDSELEGLAEGRRCHLCRLD